MQIKKWIALLCCALMLLTGCSSGYSDASVDVPGNWASYTVGDLNFRFIAGWKSGNWDPLQIDMDLQVQTVGTSNNLAIFGRLVAPAADKGTVNYMDFGYWDIGREFEVTELESVMKELDELVVPVKKLGLSSDDVQSSRIRTYGDEITALTLAYRLVSEEVSCVMQVALVPHGTRVYMISYADFSTGEDDSTLERLLSSLSFAQ